MQYFVSFLVLQSSDWVALHFMYFECHVSAIVVIWHIVRPKDHCWYCACGAVHLDYMLYDSWVPVRAIASIQRPPSGEEMFEA